jgi:hypothetical protein
MTGSGRRIMADFPSCKDMLPGLALSPAQRGPTSPRWATGAGAGAAAGLAGAAARALLALVARAMPLRRRRARIEACCLTLLSMVCIL